MTFLPSPSTGGLSMRRRARFVLLSLLAAVTLALPASAGAGVAEATSTHTYTKNMHPLGFSERAVPLTGTGSGVFNSDIAFWGKMAVHGSYEGFRLIDISDPENPVQIVNYTDCVRGTTTGNQGDVIVWDDILVRSWNSPAPAGGAMCGGILTPAGQEGLHIFDISDPANPVAKAFVATPCGSHTASGVPDLANNRLLVYNSPSSGAIACRGIDIVSVPLGNPSGASYLSFESSGDAPLGGGLENLVTIDPPSSPSARRRARPASPATLSSRSIPPTPPGCRRPTPAAR